MFERYSEPSRRVIFFACCEAIHRRATQVSTAHILLGLTREESSQAAAVVPLKARRAELCALLGLPDQPNTKAPNIRNIKKHPPLDKNSKMALAYAAQEADLDGHSSIDTDHLLRALLRFPNEACTALEAAQLDLATVRVASKRHRVDCPSEPLHSSIAGRWGSGEVPGMVARPFLTVALLALAEIILLLLARLLK